MAGKPFLIFLQMYLTAENKKSTRSRWLWKWARNISSKAFDPGWKEEGYMSIDGGLRDIAAGGLRIREAIRDWMWHG